MGRRFTSGTSDRITVQNAADLAGLSWLFGTIAALIYRSADVANFETIISTNEAGATTNQFCIGSTDLLTVYDNPNIRTLTGAIATGQHILLGFTKPTGTVAGRGHKYVFTTNTWTHAAMSGTVANAGATASLQIGSATNAGVEFLSSEVWAIGMWDRNMTDKEFERLSAGRWLDSVPSFYEQWSDGREVGDMPKTLGRFPTRQTARTGTTRGIQKPPPGFRMCKQRRRR